MNSLLVSLLLITSALAQAPITRLACGSCYKAQHDKGIFHSITADRPQLFLFMGDNIYGDTQDAHVMAEKYQQLNRQPEYATFKKTTPILATWDDHDYGQNDAGRDFPFKETSAKLFLDAFDFPKNHEARQRPGIYHSQRIGPPGQCLQLIFLDTRSFRSPLTQITKNRRKVYLPKKGPDVTMLGSTQWNWLASELKKTADLRLIISSIQVLATNHRFEKWANMPDERTRLLQLLKHHKAGPTILLSGDRHLGEISRISHTETKLPFDLYEMTSSGMTHAGAPEDPWPGRVPNTYIRKINYGLIDISWTKQKPIVSLKLKEFNGTVHSSTPVDFNQKNTPNK